MKMKFGGWGAGAEYVYLHGAFGPSLAFVFAWCTLFTIPVGLAAVARGCPRLRAAAAMEAVPSG